uniref:Hypothetical conserved protein n=1 Tax=uncultured beta proteobacterium TaxID=86027 RepID=H5SNZ1_9PROT|nr:hypothetical conserved protein [uncultured beta proteobacterium]
MRKKLPIGIQSFTQIRREGYYYVDKTPFLARMVASGGKYYFLSRPRRFGKSLLLDTIACAFSGQRELFVAHDGHDGSAPREALYLADHWEWSQRYPVVRLSFVEGPLNDEAELVEAITLQLSENARRLQVPFKPTSNHFRSQFDQLLCRIAEHYGQPVVVLVDEYDKPILDHLTNPEVATVMRNALRNLYSVLKARSDCLRFVFLTGVSKFSQVSLFSGLNNLNDITLDDDYAAICGYTDADLDTVFAPEFAAAAAEGRPLDRERVRFWYNGYWWGGTDRVYNPFDVLLCLAKREYRPWWFETATPTFLVELLKARGFFTPQLERTYATHQLLGSFDVGTMPSETLLWQTGYLTIARKVEEAGHLLYELTVPNQEVRVALNEALLDALLPQRYEVEATLNVLRALRAGDSETLRAEFEHLFAQIPYDWHYPLGHLEAYYASLFYSFLASTGVRLLAEAHTRDGRIDLVVQAGATVWVIEFKVVAGENATGAALAQLRARDYASAYRTAPGVTRVIELGVEFSKATRRIVGWMCT